MARGSALAETSPLLNPARPERPIDLVHLAKQCLGDANLEFEVLRLFDTTVATYVSRLKLATTFDELAINLHSLKGASSGVGAFGLMDQAKYAENELRAGRPVYPEMISDIAMAVEEIRVFIAGVLKNEPA